ncbi:hypothetical protein BKA62DRAFT_687123 [Auriculariales sp. MPI-PUGE-AT-0066]|nr:hypothetical protein BKA62DRAFT_687123 [Auriculariales sp. MPI-PUGE-AT-0066]
MTQIQSTPAEPRNARMAFPPSYCLVGVYRLLNDEQLRTPIWDKCRHGVQRGAIVGLVWVVLTYKTQKFFVETFLANSPSVTGLNPDSVFGFQVPLTTYATWLFMSHQCTLLLRFFLAKNLRIARERAWDQTVQSRAKGPEFWQPYIEEWAQPPVIKPDENPWKHYLGSWASRWILTKIILAPLDLYPFIGIAISAWFKALQTSRFLHLPYFEAKKMGKPQIALFVEERKWDYRVFGWAAALLESIPIVGLFFTVSNRIGAAMWAFDLEKRQHEFKRGERQPLEPVVPDVGSSMHPARTTDDRLGANVEGLKKRAVETAGAMPGGAESMTGSWEKL